MNLLCITPYYKPAYSYGGPARSVPNLCEALARHDVHVDVYTTNANGNAKVLDMKTNETMTIDSVDVCYFPVAKSKVQIMPFYSPDMGRACQNNIRQFDVVYIPGNWTYSVFAGVRSCLRHKIPYVMSPRGSFMTWSMNEKALKKRLYLSLIERRFMNNASLIHVTSMMEKEQIARWGFRPEIQVIPNGIDLHYFRNFPCRGGFRQKFDIPGTAHLTLFVGRLHKEKRLDLIIDAFAKVLRQLPGVHLAIVGAEQDGSGERTQQKVRQLGLSGNVHITGSLIGSDLLQAYADADMLILLSHRENFGMVVLEAMASGLPVLLSEEVGLAQEIGQAGAGVIVKALSNDVANAWRQLLIHADIRRAMGAKGQALVFNRFESDIVGQRMIDLFDTVIKKSGVQARP